MAISSAQANNILLSGLAIQTAAFLVFIGMSILVFYRSNRFRPVVIPRLFQFALLTSSLLVFTRTVFRLAETAEGKAHPLSPFSAHNASQNTPR